MRKAKNILANIDTMSIVLYLILILFGLLNIYASQYNEDLIFSLNMTTKYGKQLFFIIISIFLAFLMLIIDWKVYFSVSYVVYFMTILLLIGVLFFGERTGGAVSWYEIGNLKLQPSEFAKFATSLTLAKYYNSLNKKVKSNQQKILAYCIILFPLLLTILQNDLGTALIYTSFILVLFREGLSPKILFIAIITLILFILSILINHKHLIFSLLCISIFLLIFSKRKKRDIILIVTGTVMCISIIYTTNYIFNNVLSDHHRSRINILLGKNFDPHGAGYNLIQSKIAIGSGGLQGKGYLNGTQTRFDFVPEQSTDFIFCTIGEEWGFIGSFIYIVLYVSLLLRILFLAERQRSNFSRIYGYSVACILFTHFLINIGMTIGLVPVVGIPLPFTSYGGSSLIGFTILLFIFINLDSYRLQILR